MNLKEAFIKLKEHSLHSEALYAKLLTENNELTLGYTSKEESYTNGHHIIIAPCMLGLAADEEVIRATLKHLQWDKYQPDSLSFDTETALYIIAHGLLIHECFHMCYSTFPPLADSDPGLTAKERELAAAISNIIEDAYIEAIGSSYYNNVHYYLRFVRTAIALHCNKYRDQSKSQDQLSNYISYMVERVLFPLSNAKPASELQELVDKTLPLFLQGALQDTAAKRYAYAKKILNLLKEQLDLEKFPVKKSLKAAQEEGMPMFGLQSHTKDSLPNLRTGEGPKPTKTLFEKTTRPKAEPTRLSDFLGKLKEEIEESRKPEITELATPGFEKKLEGSAYSKTTHAKMTVLETHYTPLKEHIAPYESIVKAHAGVIKKYRTRFQQLIQGKVRGQESGHRFGLGIDSNRLVDVKKRYWTRRCQDRNTPDLAVEIIIDGSGSMSGSKITNARIAAVIMHEVLRACNIPHCITQHYANFHAPTHHQQVLIDFNSRTNDKYNLMRITDNQDNRDGLALLWSEKHLRYRREENKVIIIISDGQPHHGYDNYSGRTGDQDTKDCASNLGKRGTKVIAVAIEASGTYIYDALKPLYDNIVSCNNMPQLPEKLGEIITSLLEE